MAATDSSPRPWSAALLTGLVALLWLAPRVAPGVTFEDAGELAAAAVHLGVPHPPGYPLWTPLGHLATELGGALGVDPARALALWSAVCAAGACAALGALARLRRAGLPVAVGAGLLPLAAPTFTSQALIVEVYALAGLLQAGLLLAALAPVARPRTAWVLFGLGLAAHPMTLFLAPLPFVASARATGRLSPRRLLREAPLALPGLLLYLYVPWAARREPAVDWGDATGGRRLLDHLLRVQYAGTGDAPLAPRVEFASEQVIGAWAALVVPLLVLALAWARRVPGGCGLRSALVGTSLFAAAGGWWALPFDLAPEVLRVRVAPTYLPAILAVAAFAGLGLVALEARLRERSGAPWTRLAPLLLWLPALVEEPSTLVRATHMGRADGAERYARGTLAACPPEAICVLSRLGHTDVLGFPLLYGQLVWGLRPDVTAIDRSALALDWYRAQLAARAPDLAPAVARLEATLRSDPARFADPRQARLATVPFLQELFDGPRPVVMVERPSDNLLGGRVATAGVDLWWIAPGPDAAPRSEGEPWPWIDRQPPGPWRALFAELAAERRAALSR